MQTVERLTCGLVKLLLQLILLKRVVFVKAAYAVEAHLLMTNIVRCLLCHLVEWTCEGTAQGHQRPETLYGLTIASLRKGPACVAWEVLVMGSTHFLQLLGELSCTLRCRRGITLSLFNIKGRGHADVSNGVGVRRGRCTFFHNNSIQFWSRFIPVNRGDRIYPTLRAISPTATLHLVRFEASSFSKPTLLLSYSTYTFQVVFPSFPQ